MEFTAIRLVGFKSLIAKELAIQFIKELVLYLFITAFIIEVAHLCYLVFIVIVKVLEPKFILIFVIIEEFIILKQVDLNTLSIVFLSKNFRLVIVKELFNTDLSSNCYFVIIFNFAASSGKYSIITTVITIKVSLFLFITTEFNCIRPILITTFIIVKVKYF
jgi:hypothetical protein